MTCIRAEITGLIHEDTQFTHNDTPKKVAGVLPAKRWTRVSRPARNLFIVYALTAEMSTIISTQIEEEIDSMISFISSTMLGGVIGVVAMCLVQINRDEREDEDL